MKRIVMWLALMFVFASASFAQTKTITGTVLNYSVGTKGNWETIEVKTGGKTFVVYLLSMDYPAAKTVGTVKQSGRTVKVFYTRKIAASGDYASEVIAVKVVEIRQPPSRTKNR